MSDESADYVKNPAHDKVLELARSRFLLGRDAWRDIHDLALEDQKFVAGEQWPDDVKNSRKLDKRPMLTINKLQQNVRHITNEQRQNRPTIKVNPFDDNSDKDTAKIYQGLIRSIWNNSNADIAIDTAFEGAVEKSFGFFRVTPQYVDPMSFDQELIIKQITNHYSVILDPSAKEPDGSDANWGFIVDEVSRDEFKAQYPDCDESLMVDWTDSHYEGWFDKEKNICRVVEYFTREFELKEIALFSNGVILERSKVPEVLPDGVTEVKSREALVPSIKWYKLTGAEILEETDYPGQWIPIIPVYGAIKDINGEKIIESAIRHSKDSQTAYNFYVTAEAEAIALAPKAPYMVATGQIPTHLKRQWAEANTKSLAYLEYEPVAVGGQVLGAPQRNAYEPNVQALSNARMLASDDIKGTTGIHDATLGARSNETSGIAIQRRNVQAQTANFHFSDNLTRSIKHCGRILVDAIPHYYDAARTIRIIGEDDQEEIVKINQTFQDKTGQEKKVSLTGKYDVVVDIGPTYASKRQEAASTTLELMKVLPQQSAIFADVAVRNMDFPGADEVANRIKKTVPPNLLDDKDKPKGATPEELQQQIGQMQQALQVTSQQLQQAQQIIQTKALELESKERIEFAKLENDVVIEQMKAKQDVDKTAFIEHMARIDRKLDSLGVADPGLEEPQEELNQNFNQSGDEAAIETNGEMQ
jgi:hypothetical protein